MHKYHTLPRNVDGEFVWHVIEDRTGLTVKTFWFEEEANQYVSFLDAGGAFSGFTPSFICTQFTTKGDLNDMFASKFLA